MMGQRSRGKMRRQTIWDVVAPSTRAARSRSRGMDSMAAVKITRPRDAPVRPLTSTMTLQGSGVRRATGAVPSAGSRSLFGNGEMRFIRTPIIGIHTIPHFLCAEQPVWLDDRPFPMHPFGLNGIQPGAFARQATRQDTYPLPLLLTF